MTAQLRMDALPPAGWPALAPFLFASNRLDGDVRCLHSHTGEDAAAYAEELRSLPVGEACYVAARDGDVLVGVAGAEFDVSLGRAWLRGPLVAPGREFRAIAAALLDALCARLPPAVVQYAVFVTAGCAEAIGFYLGRGFDLHASYGAYTALRAAPPAEGPPPGVRLAAAEPCWRAAIGALHEDEFSGGYVTSDGLFEADTEDRMTRIALLDGKPCGYVRVHFDAHWHEGYVDFLAVAPAARRRGVGRALLRSALAWSFARPGAGAATLTVRDDRDAARALYEAAGFRRVRTCIGLRRTVTR